MKSLFSFFDTIGNALQDIFLLAVRLIWGFFFFQGGVYKLLNLDAVAKGFAALNIPFPTLNTYLVAGFETIGGILLILGLLTRITCIPLICIMIVAFLTAHSEAIKNLFTDPLGIFKESPFTFLIAVLILFVFGPGKWSLDTLIKKKISLNES